LGDSHASVFYADVRPSTRGAGRRASWSQSQGDVTVAISPTNLFVGGVEAAGGESRGTTKAVSRLSVSLCGVYCCVWVSMMLQSALHWVVSWRRFISSRFGRVRREFFLANW